MQNQLPRIDVHIHVAGTGCCSSGIWMSPRLRERYTIKLLRWLHGISPHDLDHDFDENWLLKLSTLVGQSQEIDYGVILGFDGVYDQSSHQLIEKQSQLMIPSKWIFSACKRFPQLLPGPSINPHREDALDELDYCIEQKAVLIKWLPSAEGIDGGNRAIIPFYQRLADTGIPLLIHIGGEKTFYSTYPQFNHLERFELALDLGVKIICAHSATKVLFSGETDQMPTLINFMKKYPHLWVDNSGLCNPSRYKHLPKITQNTELSERTLYGSDYPVPSDSYYYAWQMGLKKTREIQQIKNTLDRDIAIKRFFGVPERTLTKAHEVLAHLDYWLPNHLNTPQRL